MKIKLLIPIVILFIGVLILPFAYHDMDQPHNFPSSLVVSDAMANFPCHVMGDIIMGNCTDEDIERLSEFINQDDSSPSSEIIPFYPGEGLDSIQIPEAKETEYLIIANNETIHLQSEIVSRSINGSEFTFYGYNGQIPGPTLVVEQHSTIIVNFTNEIDMNTTIHWHGLRLDNENDGVPYVTQDPVIPHGSFIYTLKFPDEGIYWYHTHVREDIQQDSGLYGNILVTPLNESYYNEVNREELIIVDDILIENGTRVAYGKNAATHAIMGRFGTTMITNGKDSYSLTVNQGEVVRFYITNVANVRPFNLSFDGALMKLVGSDIGNYEIDSYVDSIVITPAERYIVEVLFDQAGSYDFLHTTPDTQYILGTIHVESEYANPDYSSVFNSLNNNSAISSDIDQYRSYFTAPIDYQLNLTVDMPGMVMADMNMEEHDEDSGMEWEDTMGEINAQTTTDDITWILRDEASGLENGDIDYQFSVGDIIKIRLFNDPESMHPMQHSIHLHGQRFLVLSEDGIPTSNFVWKDTVNIPTGSTIDILLDVTNPGEWMAHCHIAEHLEAGMMFSFNVTDNKNEKEVKI